MCEPSFGQQPADLTSIHFSPGARIEVYVYIYIYTHIYIYIYTYTYDKCKRSPAQLHTRTAATSRQCAQPCATSAQTFVRTSDRNQIHDGLCVYGYIVSMCLFGIRKYNCRTLQIYVTMYGAHAVAPNDAHCHILWAPLPRVVAPISLCTQPFRR